MRLRTLLPLSLLFAAASSTVAFADSSVFNNPDNRLYWGLRASFDIDCPGDWHIQSGPNMKMFKAGTGVNIGGIVNVPLAANLYLEPGVGIYYDTYRYDNIKIVGGDGTPGSSKTANPLVQKLGLRVPVSIGYRFDIWERGSLSVFTGPELNYSFWGNVSYSQYEEELKDYNPALFGENGQRRVNVAWTAGASLELNYNWVISLTGSFGLNDLQRNSVIFRENRVSVGIGRNF